jgi:hypothetical protein
MFLLRLLFKKERFIISRRNSGFGDNIIAAANAWGYAKSTNRTLVIVWTPSRYVTDKGENAFCRFFSVPETLEGVPVILEKRLDLVSAFLITYSYILFPYPDPLILLYGVLFKLGANTKQLLIKRIEKRQAGIDRIINDQEESMWKIFITNGCYYYLNGRLRPFFDALRLNPPFRNEVDEFAEKHFANKKVIGAHIRYYGKNLTLSNHTKFWLDETNALTASYNKIKEAVAELGDSDYVIFLCTDSRMVHDFFTQSLGNVITYEKEFGRDSSKELHQELPVETAAATIIEMFLLAKSDILVRFPPGSWFSHYASLYAKRIIT